MSPFACGSYSRICGLAGSNVVLGMRRSTMCRPRPGMNWVTWKYPSLRATTTSRYLAVADLAAASCRFRTTRCAGVTGPGLPWECPPNAASPSPSPATVTPWSWAAAGLWPAAAAAAGCECVAGVSSVRTAAHPPRATAATSSSVISPPRSPPHSLRWRTAHRMPPAAVRTMPANRIRCQGLIDEKLISYTEQYAYTAFSRIRAMPGRALEVLGGTSVVPGYNGSAIVAGSYDVLVEYGADDLDELNDILLNGLHVIPGVSWTETAIVTDFFYRGPRPD